MGFGLNVKNHHNPVGRVSMLKPVTWVPIARPSYGQSNPVTLHISTHHSAQISEFWPIGFQYLGTVHKTVNIVQFVEPISVMTLFIEPLLGAL